MMNDKNDQKSLPDYDVIIVGGGIVGLACALALAQKGFNLAIIESSAGHFTFPQANEPFDAKIVAITRRSELFFNQLGVWEKISRTRSCAYQQMNVWDASADGQILFTASEFFEPNLGYMLEQQVILGTLWQSLSYYDNVRIFTHTHLQHIDFDSQKHTIILSSGEQLYGKLVIGADGASSRVRQLAGIKSRGWDYEQSAVVAILKGDSPHHLTAFQRFSTDGSLALLPLADPYQCALVWATTVQMADDLYQMPEPAFLSHLMRECEAVMGKFSLMGRRFLFPLQTHHAHQYVQERLALIGDAAHTLHPLAGQGVNLGLLDAQALTQILIQSKLKRRDYGALNILKRYERQRKLHNEGMIWAMECFKRGFTSQNPLLQYLRNQGLNWVNHHKMIKQFFAQAALGTWPNAFW